MKFVIIGGTGLIGSKLVASLRENGHAVVPASLDTGVNTLTGAGLEAVLVGADVVVDVSNSPSFEDAAVLRFFETSTRNLLAAESKAGVRHHMALSIVGCDRQPDSGYMRAKVVQETLIRASTIPYTIIRATQFFEFFPRIADAATDGTTVKIPPVLFQPMAAEDVAVQLCGAAALNAPRMGVVEVAGPERFRFDEFIRMGLEARHDSRQVVADPAARYFGAELNEYSLVPADGAKLGDIRFEDWLTATAPSETPEPKITPVITHDLPDIAGKEALILTVDYAPGAADMPHRHNADAFVYVLEGSVVEQVKGGEPVTLTAGQTFYEGPDDIHLVGRNASSTKPAKLLAILVKAKGAPPLVPVK
ncbi:MAG TPA: cupin domain-containing protein [Gemmatimonadaceae bacterium]|nr:cupin domain-containing protein [Gemmatimonadaceae bacterium]